ncbi:MAG TPA: ankyrin repeat domain-containing protein [Candidatus Absconditabacterales bacterium]|nr:ankyrin repeat domain-containing protein [Candidatus Absconditabacterales bacterium]
MSNSNYGDVFSEQNILELIADGNIKRVKAFLESGGNVNIRNNVNINGKEFKKITGLMLSILLGDVEMVKFLLKNGADVNKKSGDGRTALIYACNKKFDLNIVKNLLKYPVDISVEDKKGNNATMYAYALGGHDLDISSDSDNAKLLRLLLNYSGVSAGIIAKSKSHLLKLIKSGEDINIKDIKGNTLLMYYVEDGSIKLVNKLIKDGADLNIQNKLGITPLMLAVKLNYIDIAKILIKNGSNCMLRDNQGNTVIDFVKEKKIEELIENHIEKSQGVCTNCGGDKFKTVGVIPNWVLWVSLLFPILLIMFLILNFLFVEVKCVNCGARFSKSFLTQK